MSKASGVYEILNTTNGKRYIGSAINIARRWDVHARDLRYKRHHSQALQRAWDKYGRGAFRFNTLLICSVDNLLLYEQLSMNALLPEYNVCKIAGSSLGARRSSETKEKLTIAKTGNSYAVGSKSRTGQRNTPEHCAAISQGLKGHPGHPFSHTSVARKKIGDGNRGKKRTPEQRAAQSARQRGVPKPPRTPEHIANNTASLRAFYAAKRVAKENPS